MTAPIPDRRRAPRALADFPIRLSQSPEAPPAILRDISEIGLACTSPHEMPEMTLVGLQFELPGGVDEHSVKGAVVRCEAQGDGRYDVAVFFTEVSDQTRSALTAFVTSGSPAP